MVCRPSVPTRSGRCCTTRVGVGRRAGPGAIPAWSCANANGAWSWSATLMRGRKKLGRQNWLACPLLQCGQIGVRVTTEAGPQGPGVAPAVETLAECGPSLPANPTQLAHSRWAQPRRRGRDQAHLPTQHGGRGGRFAPIGPALVVALRAEQMLEVVVGPRQAGQRVTMEQPGFVAAGHLAEVLDSVR